MKKDVEITEKKPVKINVESWSITPPQVYVTGTKGTEISVIDQLTNKEIGSGKIGSSGVIIPLEYFSKFANVVQI
jgi:hypothetical protein